MKLGLRELRRFRKDWDRLFTFAKEIGAETLQTDGLPDDDMSKVKELKMREEPFSGSFKDFEINV